MFSKTYFRQITGIQNIRALLPMLLMLTVFFISCGDDNPANNQTGDEGPLLGITSTPDTLIEVLQTDADINLSLETAPPPEGIQVPISIGVSDNSEKPLARFQIEAFNPEEDLEGATLAEQPDLTTLDLLVLNMVEQQASINLNVADDEFDSGPVEVTFSLLESTDESYSVDQNNSRTSFTIIEGITAGIRSSPDTLVENNLTVAEISINLNQDPGSDGLTIPLSIRASDGSSKPLARFDIAAFDSETDLQGATLVEEPDLSTLNQLLLNVTEEQATITLTVSDDEFDSGPLDVSFSIQESDDGEYVIEDGAGSTSFTIVESR